MEYKLTKKQEEYLAIKRILDIAICVPVGILLFPAVVILALAIKIDSPGPVLFKQKRVGKNKEFFEIWKFRTMFTNTPKDMPTHMLNNPEKFITRTGSFMRKYSLDELPQIYQCITGIISLIGPRPALWNQDDLVAERDKYGVNILKPGITGWAQINGRDELEIPDKARLDGEYVKKFGFWMDLKCFLGTIGSVLCHDGVVEGGTGALHKKTQVISAVISPEKLKKEIALGGVVVISGLSLGLSVLSIVRKHFINTKEQNVEGKTKTKFYLFKLITALTGMSYIIYVNVKRKVILHDNFDQDTQQNLNHLEEKDIFNEEARKHLPKRILITGANSYIGISVKEWLEKTPNKYTVDTIDMLNDTWQKFDFSGYDVVFHVAGIAHADIGIVTEEQKQLYYKVNTELAIKVAEKAKSEGVKQFILMSSMIVYSGCKEKIITADTQPQPLNFYGDSKWCAEQKIRELTNPKFKVVVLRPPMIYGKGSKGNYLLLAKIAKKSPLFPIVKNKRSLLYIDNLCEYVKLMIDNNENGVFFPQNSEYMNTSDMVQMIAEVTGNKIVMLPGTALAIKIMEKVPGKIGAMTNKAFGDCAYEMSMSEYKVNYRVISLRKSIELTEGVDE